MSFETGNNYREVADKYNMQGKIRERFLKYMETRWPEPNEKSQVGYAGEWAVRFINGIEFEKSDMEGKEVLRQIMEQI
jgi:hypothetical protein